MSRFRTSLISFLVFAVVVAVGTTFTVRALQRPAPGTQVGYTAQFTNASGLRTGDDVRVLGVQVGKVTSVSLQRGEGGRGSFADVAFSLDRDQRIFRNSKLAIRFQNLTGQRYIDLQRAAAPGDEVAENASITTEQTVPSFDITTVFNGLQPVLATMRPEDIDHFAQSVAVVMNGDGSGLGPMLDSIDKLATFTDNRAALFETLIRNFSDLSESIGGKSGSVTTLVGLLQRLAGIMAKSAPAYRVLSDQGAQVMTAAGSLLAGLGMTPNTNPWLDDLLSPEAKKLGPLVDLAAMLPGLFALLTGQGLPKAKGDSRCSKGVASLPADVQMFIRGTRVVLCNP
ncbi:Mammalian cell entry related domain protein OS=Tsukamurella paurometabola (strain ATCC 8368 / DSM / CCUG 35730 / CIP 100753 / JCM 10117 / KCTC 9821 / NBRC 16120 / NCIMB 702349 / NCTC 13040) OX=521096 GN=Tpau_4173 PE=4 SV=1 [Tsukamurella paurometabola]|uniref:Mammalian cell entry related domain protein n=1 Tax=Tsukamurella paurometabola (strain ATCC 8368 / DSM 20162 / CCUG 35730 / CIP 100753 / JCM 10117 / KCTC 9821 / NBRC 16120 / NCIMB 702349 / NCTC 13040) TaxID=521096 RepID=D5UP33_TSUPD|nr:MlaD family protein [Tsukamurella paurometabola]ADG80742.1 Mammalian cell entry related domain protein [Tsukamurella paurometabola DSM 20162]SUP40789.1 virulence factor Mce family protein [Tsukamurella paurometabola]